MKRLTFLFGLITAPLMFMNLPAAHAETELSQAPLPNILIIGDSISMEYTPLVAENLKEQALVQHQPGNAEHTGTGLQKLDQWLGNKKWDVIYFNWGLWDLCYRSPYSRVQGNRDKVRGTVTTNLPQYERNLELLVRRLEKTGALLIWAQTTVVPDGEAGRFVGDDRKYNEAAARVMKRHGIMIDGLNDLTSKFPPSLFQEPGNVHYTRAGYARIAAQVTDTLRTALNTSPASTQRTP